MMKKLLLAAALYAVTYCATAQETKFGVRAGVDIATVKVEYTNPFIGGTTSVSSSETGFFAGGFVHLGITESFALQPEVLYVGIKDFNMISIPVLAKYNFGKFGILAGPDFNYLLDAEEDEFKFNADFGASYDITEHIDVQARYSVGFGDISVSGIFIGAGYRF